MSAPAASPGLTATETALTVSSRTRTVLGLLALAGGVAFLAGLLGGGAPRAWAAFLVNLLFWSGLAIAGPSWPPSSS